MDPLPLISHPLAVNDPHLVNPCLYTLIQVFLQEGWDLLGGKGMQVYTIPDGNPYRILGVLVFPRHPNGVPRCPLFCGYWSQFPEILWRKGRIFNITTYTTSGTQSYTDRGEVSSGKTL